jgi:hypothetical protein
MYSLNKTMNKEDINIDISETVTDPEYLSALWPLISTYLFIHSDWINIMLFCSEKNKMLCLITTRTELDLIPVKPYKKPDPEMEIKFGD